MDAAEKIQLAISYAIRVSLVMAIAFSVWEQQWLSVFVASGVFIATFVPAMIERNFKIGLPLEFELIIIVFTYATLYLGEVKSYYLRFWWWDILLHGFSAIVFGMIGFLIIYTLNYEPSVKLKMSPQFVFLFSFAFAVMIGAVWEIFEFTMDQLFNTTMQKNGLVDTMGDLIIDSLGALISSFAGYAYVAKGKSPVFDNLVRKFVQNNPKLFR